MKTQKWIKWGVGLCMVVFASGLCTRVAWAVGTASGTTISNLATLSYSVGGVGQPSIGSSPTGNMVGAGTATTFLVDNKVLVTVAEVSASYTNVVPGQTQAVLTFTVTNSGNTVQDYALLSTHQVGGADPFGGTDNFDATAVSVFVDVNGNGTYESATDTATFVDELPATNPLNATSTRTVFIVANIPSSQVNNDISAIRLTATTSNGGGASVLGATTTETAGADTDTVVDVVFADVAGDIDALRDGKHSDTDAYRLQTAVISVTKTSAVLCDPFNLTTNPKSIPGAYRKYTVTIANAAGAGASATLTTISDTLDANTLMDPDLVTGAGATCATTPESAAGSGFRVNYAGTRAGFPKYFTTTSSADGVDLAAPVVTATMTTVMPVEAGYGAGELKAGESVTLIFNVVIQ